MENKIKWVDVVTKNPGSLRLVEKYLEKYDMVMTDEPDIVLSVGGDGSTIYGHNRYKKPILSVRDGKSLHYVADISLENLEPALQKIKKGEYSIRDFPLLDLRINDTVIGSAVSDISLQAIYSLDYNESGKSLRFEVLKNGEPLYDRRLLGNGILFSTVVGSSSYNQNLGGYILDMNQEDSTRFYLAVTNACSGFGIKRSANMAPVVQLPYEQGYVNSGARIIESDAELSLTIERPSDALFVVDGHLKAEIKNGDLARISLSHDRFKRISIKGVGESFREKQRRRLAWLKSQ